MEEIESVVIGAGVVGLAAAAELARSGRAVVLVERHSAFGRETSSRSSEVIHAGIYYAPGSLKARLCVEGNRLLYEFCARTGVPHRRIGKWIAAKNEEEAAFLETLRLRALENGVADLHYVPRAEIERRRPVFQAAAALASPSTGIVDSHALMKRLESEALRHGALVCYNTTVVGIEKSLGGYVLELLEAEGERTRIAAEIVVNSAGLEADVVAACAGFDAAGLGYAQQYWRGEFYKLANRRAILNEPLIYPIYGFKIDAHTVVDLQGEVRIGPLTYPAERKIDYSIDDSRRQEVYDACKPFFPLLALDDLTPDMVGISPTALGSPDDWIIAEESGKGHPGFVNLIGMKSPALTASLAIARHVLRVLS